MDYAEFRLGASRELNKLIHAEVASTEMSAVAKYGAATLTLLRTITKYGELLPKDRLCPENKATIDEILEHAKLLAEITAGDLQLGGNCSPLLLAQETRERLKQLFNRFWCLSERSDSPPQLSVALEVSWEPGSILPSPMTFPDNEETVNALWGGMKEYFVRTRRGRVSRHRANDSANPPNLIVHVKQWTNLCLNRVKPVGPYEHSVSVACSVKYVAPSGMESGPVESISGEFSHTYTEMHTGAVVAGRVGLDFGGFLGDSQEFQLFRTRTRVIPRRIHCPKCSHLTVLSGSQLGSTRSGIFELKETQKCIRCGNDAITGLDETLAKEWAGIGGIYAFSFVVFLFGLVPLGLGAYNSGKSWAAYCTIGGITLALVACILLVYAIIHHRSIRQSVAKLDAKMANPGARTSNQETLNDWHSEGIVLESLSKVFREPLSTRFDP